jgi:dihydroorotate dehydrogenase
VPLGINLGLNKDVLPNDAPADYARCFRILAAYGDYFVINVSSPNTPGLRELQKVEELAAILDAVQDANASGKPVLVKLSPDLADEDLAAAVLTAEKRAQGLVLTNTTIHRDGLDARWADEEGGLSGQPLKPRAAALLAQVRRMTKLPIVAAGGIATAEDARARLSAGADLVQLYTGLVYGGPGLPKRILRGLA